MGIEAGEKYFHLNFSLNNGKLHVHLSDQSDEESEWEGDNRERPFPETRPPWGLPGRRATHEVAETIGKKESPCLNSRHRSILGFLEEKTRNGI